MNQVRSMLNPVCSVIQSNKSMFSSVLIVIVVISHFPFDELLRTNMKATLLSNLRINGGLILKVIVAVLVLCLYLNGDVMNLVLLLWLNDSLKLF